MPRRLVIVSGLSGAGRTIALAVLSDLGFQASDAVPPNPFGSFPNSCVMPLTSCGVALGHLINHPPAGEVPNVAGLAFDFPVVGDHGSAQSGGGSLRTTFPADLERFVPNRYGKKPSFLL